MSDAREAARQQQFLEVVDRDEATRRFHEHLSLTPLGTETISLANARERVLAVDVASEIDVPGFDRSNVDGFAVRSDDTAAASEEEPRSVGLNDEVLSPGVVAAILVEPGTATPIATGGIVPRGADAVVMIEDTDLIESAAAPPRLEITRAVAAGGNVSFAGSDIARGQTVLHAGTIITSREIGVLAAIGFTEVTVFRKPRVAVVSTGNEIVPPGDPLPIGSVYDSNLPIVCAAVEELGGEPVPLGVVADDAERLQAVMDAALDCDAVVMSGGTSKGAGDLSYRIVSRFDDPGIVAHGVALKPGKPICLAVTNGKPVVVLPGFPTSAIFTFHEFVAPVLRAMAGRMRAERETVTARLPMRVNSARGRTEYLLVGLVRGDDGLVAYPMGKGSGSVTTFSHADGFVTIDQHTEYVEADTELDVTLLDRGIRPADLVVIGSHCVGLDFLLGELVREGCGVKALFVGSMGGLAAARRGECDLAGMHLVDPKTGRYNRPLLPDDVELLPGYRRMQCFVFRPDDDRFAGKTLEEAVAAAVSDSSSVMINRNPGSGTRVLIDELLNGARPPGYFVQPKSHNAVATAIAQQRADWGVTIETVANEYDLATIPIRAEHYDFAVPKSRLDRPAVQAFRGLLESDRVRTRLEQLGFDIEAR